MIDRFAKLVNPLLVLIALALGIVISSSILPEPMVVLVKNLLTIVGLFTFGLLLSYRKRHNRSWLKKVVISIIMFMIVITQLNIAQFNTYLSIFDVIVKNNAILYGLIIYCGWAFFE
jgi:hypothetical protein